MVLCFFFGFQSLDGWRFILELPCVKKLSSFVNVAAWVVTEYFFFSHWLSNNLDKGVICGVQLGI